MHFDVSHHHVSAVHVSTPCSTLASEPNSSQYASSAEWITDRKDDAHEGRTASHQRRPARPPLPPDQLAAAARTPLLVRVETVATDLSDDRLRAIERSQFLRRVNVDVPRATPATGTGLDVDERQLLRPVTKSDARSPSQRSSVQVRSPSPAAPTWVACDPTPARLLPGCHRDQETRSQIDYFSCGAVRSPAQSFSLHRAV